MQQSPRWSLNIKMQQLIHDCQVMKEHNLKLTRASIITSMETRKVSKAMIEYRKSEIAPILIDYIVYS